MPILKCSEFNRIGKDKKGFTLVELLVVMALVVMLTSTLIIYSRTSERQFVLLRDEAKIIGALQQAKSQSLGSFIVPGGQSTCGYGVHFATTSIVIFKDLSPSASSTCFDVNNVYDTAGQPQGQCGNNEECVSVIQLDKAVEFSAFDFHDIVYIPPDPKIIIDNSPKTQSYVRIRTVDGNLEREIGVNVFGEINRR